MNYKIYSDGSYNIQKKVASWAFLVILNNQVIHKNKGILDGEINSMRNVAGELRAITEAIEYCKHKKIIADFYVDFVGVKAWCADIWGDKPWRANNCHTQQYRDFIFKNKQYIKSINLVEAHGTDYFNNMVDTLAKI